MPLLVRSSPPKLAIPARPVLRSADQIQSTSDTDADRIYLNGPSPSWDTSAGPALSTTTLSLGIGGAGGAACAHLAPISGYLAFSSAIGSPGGGGSAGSSASGSGTAGAASASSAGGGGGSASGDAAGPFTGVWSLELWVIKDPLSDLVPAGGGLAVPGRRAGASRCYQGCCCFCGLSCCPCLAAGPCLHGMVGSRACRAVWLGHC